MTIELTTAEKIRKLPWSMAANSANTVFVQLTYFGSVFVLFLNTLGLDKTQIGFLLALIPFADVIALFIAPWVARFGYKRTYLTFFGLRSVITLLLLLIPMILTTYGPAATLFYITIIVAVFAIGRSVAVTAAFPWIQEYVPNSVRGKYSATNSVFTTITGFVTITAAGIVLQRTSGLNGFMILISVGILFGFATVWAATHIPGGAPVRAARVAGTAYRGLLTALRDRNMLRYLFGAGCLTLAIVPLNSFVSLFMREQVGLTAGNVVLIQTGVLAGGLLSTYLWGWTADRYGSRPIMLSGALIRVFLPILWMLMPRNDPISLYVALGIALLQGVADMGWVIGATRMLYVSVVPSEKKTEYMALYSAWVGVVSGLSQLLGGQIVQLAANVSGKFLIFTLDPYSGLFVLGFALPILGIFLLRRVQADSEVTVEEFAGLFLRGNPLLAMTSLVTYHLVTDERAVVQVTERLGQTRSPLTVDELLEALTDPRFNVRLEAIISIARTRPDPRLIEALVGILNGTELALSVIAAWALGRIGDPAALQALRQGLDSKYHSIRAHCARALGTLDDQIMAPILSNRLKAERDKGLQMAYASALGKLQATESTDQLLDLLETTQNEGARLELALSVARLVGDEGHFIQLVRETRQDLSTGASQAATALKRKIPKDQPNYDQLLILIDACANSLAHDDFEQGAAFLDDVIQQLSTERLKESGLVILRACSKGLAESKATRQEYLLLILHILNVGWES